MLWSGGGGGGGGGGEEGVSGGEGGRLRRTFAGIKSKDGVRMCKPKIRCVSSHPYYVLYIT